MYLLLPLWTYGCDRGLAARAGLLDHPYDHFPDRSLRFSCAVDFHRVPVESFSVYAVHILSRIVGHYGCGANHLLYSSDAADDEAAGRKCSTALKSHAILNRYHKELP